MSSSSSFLVLKCLPRTSCAKRLVSLMFDDMQRIFLLLVDVDGDGVGGEVGELTGSGEDDTDRIFFFFFFFLCVLECGLFCDFFILTGCLFLSFLFDIFAEYECLLLDSSGCKSSNEFDDSEATGERFKCLGLRGVLSYDDDLDFFLETCRLGDNLSRS